MIWVFGSYVFSSCPLSVLSTVLPCSLSGVTSVSSLFGVTSVCVLSLSCPVVQPPKSPSGA